MRNNQRAIAKSVRVHLRNYCRDIFLNRVLASALLPKPFRWRALRLAGLHVEHASIAPGTFFGSSKIKIGSGSHISYYCFFDALDWITIGNNCDIAMRCTFITSTHEIGNASRRAGASNSLPIHIENGCWIGGNVTVMPGVRIGAGTIIAAGSVVTKNCEPNSIYAGVPAVRKGPVPH